jgi:hypothetical protein
MGEKLATLARAQGGVLRSGQALAGGISADDLRGRVARGIVLRLRKGLYVDAALVEGADDRVRHGIDVAAAILSYESDLLAPGGAGQRLLAGHRSAALLWKLPAPGLTPVPPPAPSLRPSDRVVLLGPGTVELINADRGRRATRHGVRVRPAAVPPEHVAQVDGLPVTSRARTAVDVARLGTFRQGVFAADRALRDGAMYDELKAAADFCRSWPGGANAVRVAAFADGRAQSVAESLARVVLAENGITSGLDLQVPLRDGAGGVVYRLDIVIDGRVDLEIDGKIKYDEP